MTFDGAKRANLRSMTKEEEELITRKLGDVLKARAEIEKRARPWRKGVAATGWFPCPICKKGTLKYSRASNNGHIRAACSTDGCVKWVE